MADFGRPMPPMDTYQFEALPPPPRRALPPWAGAGEGIAQFWGSRDKFPR